MINFGSPVVVVSQSPAVVRAAELRQYHFASSKPSLSELVQQLVATDFAYWQ
jgi:hypothetical protein